MSNNPINLTIRFLLELAGLAAMAYWGLNEHEGIARFAWALGLMAVASAVWGIFRIEGEPGHAPVAVHGIVRLVIEIVFFGASVWLLALSAGPTAAIILGAIVVLHYAASYDRVLRMVLNEKPVPIEWGKPQG